MTPIMRGKVRAALERGDQIDAIARRFGLQRGAVLEVAMALIRQKKREENAPQ